MPSSDDLSVAFARLGMLGQSPDVNIRPVLLRVVVDLFLQKPHHAPEDLKLFEAMVTPLLENLDAKGRKALTDKLFGHPATPQRMLDRLMDDEGLIEAEVYRHASIPEAELLATARDGSAPMAAAVAARANLPDAVLQVVVTRPEARVALALVDNRDLRLGSAHLQILVDRARLSDDLAERLALRVTAPLALAPLFPRLSPQGRRHVLDALRRQHLGRRHWARPNAATVDVLAKLDRLALCGEWDSFDIELCQALNCEHRRLRPLLHDGAGDVMALALAAAGATSDMAARAFILGDPAIGRSVGAVRRLATLVDTVAPGAARQFIAAMLDVERFTSSRPVVRVTAASSRRHEPDAEAAARVPHQASDLPRRARG